MEKDKKTETILVLVLALIICYWKFEKTFLLVLAVVLGSLGLFVPYLSNKIHVGWMKLSHVLGFFMSRLLLTIIFFAVLVPFSLMAKLSGRRNMQLKPGKNSYFKSRNYTYTKESMENTW